jgi:hypothetical protein
LNLADGFFQVDCKGTKNREGLKERHLPNSTRCSIRDTKSIVYLSEQFQSVCIQPQKDKQEHGKGPEGGSPVAEKGQGDANDRQQANGHSYVYYEVKQYDRNESITEYPAEGGTLPFGQVDHPQQEAREKQDNKGSAQEAPLFSNGAENEIGALFGNEMQLGLRALQVPLP